VHVLAARTALSGFPGRLAMRGRHVSELTHALARVMRSHVMIRDRRAQLLRRRLDGCDIGRRLGAIGTRLAAADGRLASAVVRRHDHAGAQLREYVSRLETLSPLAVLGRGYAVAWNADKTHVLREAGRVGIGARIHVTLAHGELGCEVQTTTPDTKKTKL
jgi:exodeoxyribonuclease VII large subunit